jgi:hypothetical protein
MFIEVISEIKCDFYLLVLHAQPGIVADNNLWPAQRCVWNNKHETAVYFCH